MVVQPLIMKQKLKDGLGGGNYRGRELGLDVKCQHRFPRLSDSGICILVHTIDAMKCIQTYPFLSR